VWFCKHLFEEEILGICSFKLWCFRCHWCWWFTTCRQAIW